MNHALRLTMTRIVLAIIILIILMIPYRDLGIILPTFQIMGKVVVDIKYIVAGFLFVIASVTDYLDGFYARKEKNITEFSVTLDSIADKILVNGVLILLAYDGFISVIIPVVIVIRDIAVNALRTLISKNHGVMKVSKLGQLKTLFMMSGISLVLFYNLPFEIWGIYVADILIIVATILSITSGVLYYTNNKEKLKFN